MKFSEFPTTFKVMFFSAVIFFIFIIGVAIFHIFDKTPPTLTNYNIQTIDSCEYIISDYCKSRNITHKGNCKFCRERTLITTNKDSIEVCPIR